jgi:hypothetical protein
MSWSVSNRGTGDNILYSIAGTPSLDLRFASTKTLTDYVTNTNLVTFTRGSSATYVGSDGLLKTAVTNLLTFSEQFDNAAWTTGQATITANGSSDPTGGTGMDLAVATTASSIEHRVFRAANTTVSASSTVTFSIYAKAAGLTRFRINIYNDPGRSKEIVANVNLSTGTIATATAGGGYTAVGQSIQAFAGGIYRVSVTGTVDAATTGVLCDIGLQNSSGNLSFTGDGTSGIFLWGAQLEVASTVGDYVPTTTAINSAPRFDHNPTTGESLGLLVEEARTNLLVQSENLGTTWTITGLLAFGSGSTLNATVAPDGQATADLLTENSSTSEHRLETAAISWVANTTYTVTIWAKANGRTRFDFFAVGGANFSGGRQANFNLSTGTVISTDGSVASITAFSNGWYRARMTLTTSASPSSSSVFIRMNSNTDNFNYAGDGTSGIFFWGAQLEAGAFPTSYIPTTTATVTRSADVASITGSAFSSWYRQDAGTSLIEYQEPDRSGTRTPRSFSDGTTNNRWDMFINSSTIINNRVVIGGTQNNPGGLISAAGGLPNRHVIAVGLPNANAAINGVLSTSSTSSSVPAVDRLIIGADSTGLTPLTGTIRRLTFWPQRLSNPTLQSITQ